MSVAQNSSSLSSSMFMFGGLVTQEKTMPVVEALNYSAGRFPKVHFNHGGKPWINASNPSQGNYHFKTGSLYYGFEGHLYADPDYVTGSFDVNVSHSSGLSVVGLLVSGNLNYGDLYVSWSGAATQSTKNISFPYANIQSGSGWVYWAVLLSGSTAASYVYWMRLRDVPVSGNFRLPEGQ